VASNVARCAQPEAYPTARGAAGAAEVLVIKRKHFLAAFILSTLKRMQSPAGILSLTFNEPPVYFLPCEGKFAFVL
jgi:hypothetical protein